MIDTLRRQNNRLHLFVLVSNFLFYWLTPCVCIAERIVLQLASCLVETTKPQDYKHSPQYHMADTMGDRNEDEDKTTIGQSFWSGSK